MTVENLGRRPRKTRKEIYSAAILLFSKRGVTDVTMQDIADRAETARSTVFNHYANKNALLEEFFKRFSEDILAKTKAKKLTGLKDNVYALFDELGKSARKYPRLLKAIAPMALGAGPLAEREADLDTQFVEFLHSAVSAAMKTGEINKKYDAHEIAELLLALITVTNHDWVNKSQESDLAADQKRRFDILVGGLRP